MSSLCRRLFLPHFFSAAFLFASAKQQRLILWAIFAVDYRFPFDIASPGALHSPEHETRAKCLAHVIYLMFDASGVRGHWGANTSPISMLPDTFILPSSLKSTSLKKPDAASFHGKQTLGMQKATYRDFILSLGHCHRCVKSTDNTKRLPVKKSHSFQWPSSEEIILHTLSAMKEMIEFR